MRTATKDRVAIKFTNRDSIVVDIRHDKTSTLFGEGKAWWAECAGTRCCPDAPIDMLHIDRVDAIECARYRVLKGEWAA